MRDLSGRKLGPYEIRDVIGHGGMATVYRAYQPALNRYVAIKVLSGAMAQDTEFVARFQREALAAGGLDHPNILRIYDANTVDDDRQYIAMAYAPGGTLAQQLRKSGALPANEAADLIAQVADALNYAHRRGIVHRDIKPSNILLDEEGRPLLADFGIAQAIQAGPRLTQTGSSLGTPEYMSPEQAEGLPVDGRSDLFSLGIVLYQVVTAKLPFHADTSIATMFQVVHRTPLPPRSIDASIPTYLDSIIQKALAKDPNDRFQTGKEMAQALRERRVVAVPLPPPPMDEVTAVHAPVRTEAGARHPTPLPPSRAAGASSSRPLLMGLLVVALIAILGAGGYLAWTALQPKATPAAAATGPLATALQTDTPLPEPTDPPTSAPTLKPTTAGGVFTVKTATPDEEALAATMPAPTEPAAVENTRVPESNPTVAPTVTPVTPEATEAIAASPMPPPTVPRATKAAPTQAPPAVPVVTAPGVVLNFESFGNWKIGDEKNGTLTASTEQAHSGQASAKLAYQFPASAKNYVVFRRVPPAPIPGRPASLKLWVYGDGSGHFLNAWIRDSQSELRSFTFGQVNHTGWQEMTASLDTTAPWPQAHISGPDNGVLDFPISLDSFVFDGVPDGGGPFSGAIYLDDLSTSDVAAAQPTISAAAATAAPVVQAEKTPTQAAVSGPPAGLTGHIAYTSGTGDGTGVSVLDVANRNTWDLRPWARQPAMAPDGRVMVNGIGGGKDSLYTVDLGGANERQAGAHPEDSYASWSPSGVSVTFHSSFEGDHQDRISSRRTRPRRRAGAPGDRQDAGFRPVSDVARELAHCLYRLQLLG